LHRISGQGGGALIDRDEVVWAWVVALNWKAAPMVSVIASFKPKIAVLAVPNTPMPTATAPDIAAKLGAAAPAALCVSPKEAQLAHSPDRGVDLGRHIVLGGNERADLGRRCHERGPHSQRKWPGELVSAGPLGGRSGPLFSVLDGDQRSTVFRAPHRLQTIPKTLPEPRRASSRRRSHREQRICSIAGIGAGRVGISMAPMLGFYQIRR
jgi:hypothetical protein